MEINRSLNQHKTIALLIDNLSGLGSYQEAIWQGVSHALKASGDSLLIYSGGALNFSPLSQFEQHKNIIYDLVRKEYIDGVVLCGGTLGNYISKEEFQGFLKKFKGIPLVSIGARLEGVTSVMIDNESGLLKMFNHLIEEHNFRKIAFISGPEENEDARQRLGVYRKALGTHGIPLVEDLVFTGKFLEISGCEAVRHWLDIKRIKPEAIVAANDNMAIGAVKELQKRGLHVPNDLAVTGFDDIFEASVLVPGLSTIRQPVMKQAQRATEILLEIIGGKKPESEVIALETELVFRRSCGCTALKQQNGKKGTAEAGTNQSYLAEEEKYLLQVLQKKNMGLKEVELLYEALRQAIKENTPSTFISVWEEFLLHSISNNDEIEIAKKLLAIIRENILSELDEGHKSAAHNIIYQAQDSMSAMVCRVLGSERLEITDIISRITTTGTMNNTFEIESMVKAIFNILPTFHINNFIFALYKNKDDPLANLEIICQAEGGKQIALTPESKSLSASKLFLTDFFQKNPANKYVILPLFSLEQQFGLLVVEIAVEYGFIYEIIYSQLCGSLIGATLLKKNMAVKKEIENRNQVIENLSLPMIESIGDISQMTSEKMLMISTLIELTKQSWSSIKETNSNIDKIAEHSSKLAGIIEAIEEIAEQVNILALNTAIQAARVGKYGASFAVLAKEIKLLSENTRQHSVDIAQTLKEIVSYTNHTARVGQESVKSFQEQEKGVDEILESFKAISVKMEKLMENSSSILEVIKKS